ncbi:MAG: NfeD family protein [Rikenellaceae bacterium]
MWALAWVVIFTLIILGVVATLVEMLLLPGLTIGALFALAFFTGAVYVSFESYGVSGGLTTIMTIFGVGAVAVLWALRSKTWERVKLRQRLAKSRAKTSPNEVLRRGDIGETVSRLSPMGAVRFMGMMYEAKSLSGVIDPKRRIVIEDFENSAVIVRELSEGEA